jgi:3-oxoacyl-(acyl-carrier-protein) synthase
MVGACQPHAIGAALVQSLDIPAALTTVSEACPSGLDAVLIATRMIKDGRADMVIAGGADSPLNSAAVAGFAASGLPSLSSDCPPGEISRPFDAKRTGVVLSEGAGFVILERLDSALARGATPYLEVLGGAMVTDTPGGEKMDGLYQAMETALANAGVYPEQIDYVCANAFGAPQGDQFEVAWIKQCLGERAYRIPVSSIRGVLGHALSAAGMSQVIALALMMRHRTVVPTANLRHPDPACDLDHVPLQYRRASIRMALANSHGIGGENGTLVVQSLA